MLKRWVLLCCLSLPLSIQAAVVLPEVFVSVLPQKYLLQRIAGDQIQVEVMVGPGQSPETYEPTPRQMVKLSSAGLYFSIGVPFEQVWMKKIEASHPQLKVINVDDQFASGNSDGHSWTSPVKAKRISQVMLEALIDLDPANEAVYRHNYQALQSDLEALHNKISSLFSASEVTVFMVMHPAWSNFAETYGLQQLAIEQDGKDPGTKTLAALINKAREEKINTIFVQQQHSDHLAETVAKTLGARIVSIDPLAENYLENLYLVATLLANSQGKFK